MGLLSSTITICKILLLALCFCRPRYTKVSPIIIRIFPKDFHLRSFRVFPDAASSLEYLSLSVQIESNLVLQRSVIVKRKSNNTQSHGVWISSFGRTHPITLCQSGSDAMDVLKKLEIEGTAALVFLDLVMSPVSGLDVLNRWSQNGVR